MSKVNPQAARHLNSGRQKREQLRFDPPTPNAVVVQSERNS
ncbi:hypothetical protein I546_0752 [Mycobacterium kansasii 732]|nr:hypothetical protein I546_0752 [Mycobacterium kansasii 732]